MSKRKEKEKEMDNLWSASSCFKIQSPSHPFILFSIYPRLICQLLFLLRFLELTYIRVCLFLLHFLCYSKLLSLAVLF